MGCGRRKYTSWRAIRLTRRNDGELLTEVEQIVNKTRLTYCTLGEEFQRIWLSESKPYALDWTMKRYRELGDRYDDLAGRVAEARKAAERGEALPSPEEIGLAVPAIFSRQTRPHQILSNSLQPDSPWTEPTATHRLGISIDAGTVDRHQLPIELAIDLPDDLAARPVQAFQILMEGKVQEIPAQLDQVGDAKTKRLVLLIPGPVARQTTANIYVYFGRPEGSPPLPEAVSASVADDGGVVIQNNLVRLLLGAEGAHVYRWHVAAANDSDVTTPGLSDWSGFSDLGGAQRRSPNALTCLARGPALARYSCVDTLGMVKTISLFGGCSWMEVVLSEPVEYYWDFDNPKNFAADGPSPGQYLFSNGATGPVGSESSGVSAQVKAQNVHWAIKWNDQKLALGMAAPEVPCQFVVAPGSGAGGVGIEASPPASHFVTYAGVLAQDPSETMSRLVQTLDFRNQPKIAVYALERKP